MWEDPTLWYEWIKVGAFIAGLVVGAVAVFSPSWVWLRKQLISTPAVWLATLGTVMVTMSIWQSVQIEGAGFKASITGLQARFDALDTATAELSRDIDAVQQAIARPRASTAQPLAPLEVGAVPPGEGMTEKEAIEETPPWLRGLYVKPTDAKRLRKMLPGLARTKLIVSHMLSTCETALGELKENAYPPSVVELLEATTEEAAWAVLERCTTRLRQQEKPKP